MAAALTIRWTSLAADHLEAAHAYLVEENPRAAGRLIDRILAGIEMLQRYPNLGRNGRVQGTRELVISGTPFVVPYRVSVLRCRFSPCFMQRDGGLSGCRTAAATGCADP